MTNVEKDLLDFHNKFAVFMRDTPGFLDEDLMKFRIGFIEEEFVSTESGTGSWKCGEEIINDSYKFLPEILH